ncbi:hypothetical protein GCM10023189_52930 [Nibrella saemangeumensis]|uniref:Secretion system C-terminal sorting domain-containing protein n=1 Tax=Nibrella saemangeumensis TaxID=1084526 RepID=A0ABP8NMZ2_9BACT
MGTHLMGGYIQVKKTASSTLEYEYNVILFLNTGEGNDASTQQEQVSLCFGDGTTGQAMRISRQPLEQNRNIGIHIYRATHTYAGPGAYTASASVNNRTPVRNLTDAVNKAYFMSTTFSTNLSNSTPVLGIPANGFSAAANQRTTFNLRSTDTDGDSLVYSLAYPLTSIPAQMGGACAQNVSTIYPFQFPNDVTQRGTFKLNSRTGDLVWDAPVEVGRFSFAMSIEEWRNGTKIGTTLYEMIIIVEDRNSQPGTLPPYESAFTGPVITSLAPGYPNEDIHISVFPNPTSDRVQVRVSSRRASTLKLQMMSSNGRVLGECSSASPEAEHLSEFGMVNLPTGLYLLRTEIGGRSYMQKIVKQ